MGNRQSNAVIEHQPSETQRVLDIEMTLAVLRSVWKQYPQLRLCQLISNALPEPRDRDPYYVTDTEVRDFLRKYPSKVGT